MSAPEAWHVTRTMRALELLALRPRSAVEVANAIGIHPRTARRLLNRLLAEGYVRRTAPRGGKYGITTMLTAVGQHALEEADLVQEALPHVARLRVDAEARAHLSVPSYRSARRLVDEEVEQPGRVRVQVGEKEPCHCSASGQVLLAFRPRWRESVLMRPLESYTEQTVVDPEALRARLADICSRGYAVESGELAEAMGSVAAPVFDHTGDAVAALGITVQSMRLRDADRLSASIVLAARRVSTRLGYVAGTEQADNGLSETILNMVPAARNLAG